jgi:hypothetical protein
VSIDTCISPSIYSLLGLSAFSGFIVHLAGWHLNSFVTNAAFPFRRVSASRDKRMAILNEFISVVKLIKFSTWEDCCINWAMDM